METSSWELSCLILLGLCFCLYLSEFFLVICNCIMIWLFFFFFLDVIKICIRCIALQLSSFKVSFGELFFFLFIHFSFCVVMKMSLIIKNKDVEDIVVLSSTLFWIIFRSIIESFNLFRTHWTLNFIFFPYSMSL